MLKKILIALVIVLVIIQFIQPPKNATTDVSPKDITVLYPVSDSVKHILQKACFDCHSNNTRYPWYNHIQPVAWWLRSHINEGKQHLNFSEFGMYDKTKQVKKLKQIGKSVKEGWMPISSYLWIHKDARLTAAEVATLVNWSDSLATQIAAKQ